MSLEKMGAAQTINYLSKLAIYKHKNGQISQETLKEVQELLVQAVEDILGIKRQDKK